MNKLEKQTVYLPENTSILETFSFYQDPIKGYFFTPEQLNQLLSDVIKDVLDTAAEKANTTLIIPIEDGCRDFKNAYDGVNKQSITNTFEESFNKFKVE